MSDCTNDPAYLRDEQYKDSSNLDARIYIHQHFSTNPYGWSRFVFDHLLTLPPTARVLEVGAGPGSLWRDARERIPPGWRMTLTDLSSGMVEQSRGALVDHPAFIDFRVAEAGALPFEDGSFDGVIANHMLYHVPDVEQALSELRRVLKPGGRLFAATNGEAHMQMQWELMRRFRSDFVAWHAPMMRVFSLQNGGEKLARHFGQVELHHYEDSLRVTEVDPLVAYVASMALIAPDDRIRFRAFIEETLRNGGGVIEIDKETGLFEAR